ncbi:hypothetical protein EII34_10030 [Arachnia propionica]|uniref:Uncharacterized protein n=1 Tax=Arachnia propionica TaxID=1750 RepID=A0A3P1T4Z2_9ACTN|nr:hypothetical protein [Arachnia propionica]RRD04394.1 hypothetical protein EII34_10030 [Arachnia propionica]
MTIDIPDLIRTSQNAEDLVSRLEALSDAERTALSGLAPTSLTAWRKDLDPGKVTPSAVWLDEGGEVAGETFTQEDVEAYNMRLRVAARLVLAAVALGVPAAKVAALFTLETVYHLHGDGGIDPFVRLATARGPEWTATFITRVLRNRRLARTTHPLVSRLVATVDIPIPDSLPYLNRATSTMPTPGTRWQEHFLAACATPGTFNNATYDREEYVARIREAAARLRRSEPTDDPALLDGLLGVIERGERPTIQRQALAWIEGLDLDPTTRPERMLGALDVADAHVVAAFTRALLGTNLDDEALVRLALAILPRKEKGLGRDVLKRLGQLTTPTAELVDLVTELARGTDTTAAKLASTLCESWGGAPTPETGTRGLWRDPALPDPEPFPGLDPLVLAEPDLLALIQDIRYDSRTPELEERLLAALVATASKQGARGIVALCRSIDPDDAGSALTRLLGMLGDGTIVVGTEPPPPTQDGDSLSFLGSQRIRGVLHRLGELPVLLSTPGTNRWQVTAADLRRRIERYRQGGVALEPADLAVALARCDRDRCDELVGIDAPVRGLDDGFASILVLWREATVEPPTFVVDDPVGWRRPINVHGDEPWWHEVLGVASREHCIPAHLLPAHLARPVGEVLNDIARSGPAAALERLLGCLAVARRVDEPLAVATLATAGVIPVKDRAALAAELLQAWDEGRLIPDDLAAAWHSPLWEQFWPSNAELCIERADGKVTALLALVAEAGGLALVWPLLAGIAERAAGAEQIPATASAVLETVLALLPEVPHEVELPTICALAGRKGSSKAIKTARLIVANMAKP